MINGKVYIGKTIKKLGCRWNGTLEGAIEDYGYNKHLIRAMKKYGINNFKRIVIDSAKDLKETNKKEIYWIAFYKSNDRKYGYNLTDGGEGGVNWRLYKTPEELKESKERTYKSMIKVLAKRTPEEWKEIGEKRNKTMAKKTPEELEETSGRRSKSLAKTWAEKTPEEKKRNIEDRLKARAEGMKKRNQKYEKAKQENNYFDLRYKDLYEIAIENNIPGRGYILKKKDLIELIVNHFKNPKENKYDKAKQENDFENMRYKDLYEIAKKNNILGWSQAYYKQKLIDLIVDYFKNIKVGTMF